MALKWLLSPTKFGTSPRIWKMQLVIARDGQQFQIKVRALRAATLLVLFRACMKSCSLSIGIYSESENDHIDLLNYIDLYLSRMINKVWAHIPYIFSTHVFLIFFLRSTYNHSLLKYRCSFKMRHQIRHIYLTQPCETRVDDELR